eukprot:2528247-Pyramimonas_sp.AAC.1
MDVLRTIILASLGHAASPRGLCLFALWVSSRGARRAGSMRSTGARRSQGVGLHRKSGRQRRRSHPNREGAETVGHGMLRVAVAWAMYASP